MKKFFVLLITSVCAGSAFAHGIGDNSSYMNTGSGRYSTRPLAKEDLEELALSTAETDERLLVPVKVWKAHARENYNTFAAPRTGRSIPYDATASQVLYEIIRDSEEVTANWQVQKNAEGKVIRSEVNTTYYFDPSRTGFRPKPRAPYYQKNEKVLKDKGIEWISLYCANPLQYIGWDEGEEEEQDVFAGFDVVTTKRPSGSGDVNIFLRVDGARITNSGNSFNENETPASNAKSAPTPKAEDNIEVVKTIQYSTAQPSVVYQQSGLAAQPVYQPQPVYQSQPQQQGCCPTDPQLLRYTKQNRDANIAGAVGSWVAPFSAAVLGWGLNQLFPPPGNSYNYGYGQNGTIPNAGGPSDWPNGLNTSGKYPNTSGSPVDWINGN